MWADLTTWATANKDLLTLVLSITVLVSSLLTLRVSSRRAVRPMLVFDYTENGWFLRNIGTGAALNVLVAEVRKGKWDRPRRVPPMPKDGSLPLTWCLHVNDAGLGATYQDAYGTKFTTICGNDLNRIRKGHKFGGWSEAVIKRHWEPADHSA